MKCMFQGLNCSVIQQLSHVLGMNYWHDWENLKRACSAEMVNDGHASSQIQWKLYCLGSSMQESEGHGLSLPILSSHTTLENRISPQLFICKTAVGPRLSGALSCSKPFSCLNFVLGICTLRTRVNSLSPNECNSLRGCMHVALACPCLFCSGVRNGRVNSEVGTWWAGLEKNASSRHEIRDSSTATVTRNVTVLTTITSIIKNRRGRQHPTI